MHDHMRNMTTMADLEDIYEKLEADGPTWQTPAEFDAAAVANSPPAPCRNLPGETSPRSARKRTNEEIYVADQQLKSSPVTGRSQLPFRVSHQDDRVPPNPQTSEFDRSGFTSFQNAQSAPSSSTAPVKANIVASTAMATTSEKNTFLQEMQSYEQQLELEYQEYEQALPNRDRGVDLEELDWDDLEHRYSSEIRPRIDAEREIMNELGARFQVGFKMDGRKNADGPKAVHVVDASIERA